MIARSRLTLNSLRVACPCTDAPAVLEAGYQPDSGVLLLTDFVTQHPSFPRTERALDCLEAWSAGLMEGDEFVPLQHFQRTAKQPELPLMCVLPADLPHLVVQTVDAASRKAVFRWR